jgi:hypothetical protein
MYHLRQSAVYAPSLVAFEVPVPPVSFYGIHTFVVEGMRLLYWLLIISVDQIVSHQRRRSQHRIREERGSKIAFGVFMGCGAYFGSGQLYTTWQPGGMAYRPIRRQLLSPNQRAAASFAGAAFGITVARQLLASHGNGERFALWVGRGPVALQDLVEDALLRLKAKRLELERQRREAERKAWLRENTRRATIVRPQ